MKAGHVFTAICALTFASAGFGDETGTESPKPAQLRLLNTSIFGKPTTEAVVLLQPAQAGPVELDPETVMVDVNKGKYFAATVNYPKTISFEDARKSLNKVYKKWENKSFAADPDMGIWRDDDEQVSIQLSQDGFSITVIYLKLSLVGEERIDESLDRVTKVMEDEENAKRAVSTMRRLVVKGDFGGLYRDHCGQHLRRQTGEREFTELMQGDEGKKVTKLLDSIAEAIKAGDGHDTLATRFGVRDNGKYEFVLVKAKEQGPNLFWHLELEKENGAWKLRDFD